MCKLLSLLLLLLYLLYQNHDSRVPTKLGYSPLTQGFTVEVGRAFAKGEQALISYGNKGNDELLQFYG
jgi:hypothetical protein